MDLWVGSGRFVVGSSYSRSTSEPPCGSLKKPPVTVREAHGHDSPMEPWYVYLESILSIGKV